MTWSILARDAHGNFGIAIASKFFAVGALCMHTRRGVGAVATQALINPSYGPEGLDLLNAGHSAADAVRTLTSADTGREHRQLHVLPAHGAPAAHTGAACVDWCGQMVFDDFSVAGNMLAGAAVIEATAQAYRDASATGSPLAERLIAALLAGEAAGGDKRGKQGAALRIHGAQDHLELDLRVDDHAEPLTELQRLYDKSLERFQPFVTCLAGSSGNVRHPGLTDHDAIEARIDAFHAARYAARR